MSVYVDDMFRKATVPNGRRAVSSEWRHMEADTRESSTRWPTRSAFRRSYIQKPGHPVYEHYDVTRPMRARAIAAGAIPMTMLELAEVRNRWRAAWRAAQEGQVKR
ncbi:DUF4031 domain-containing protein [Pseudactinotalea sp.]|uniref:DUF4031 domain-containing protein n=1 Tax=Pseudactinotalea sp. TaxID=1926260 RepID=UPI003B3BD8E3